MSPATRDRVVAAALELDYMASPSASSLASGRTSTVAAVTPRISTWFFGQLLAGAESVLREAGLDLLVQTVATPERRSSFFAELPLRRRADALMVLALPLDGAEAASLAGLGMPVTVVGLAVPGLPSVHIDDARGAMSAVNHLLGLGHRRIAMISGRRPEGRLYSAADDRRTGYLAALDAAGLHAEPGYDVDGRCTAVGGEAAMTRLLSRPVLPSAVFAHSDEMAMGALRAIRKAGLRCPHDISVVGFDDHELAELFDLTTVSQPAADQGASAARHLVAALRGVTPPASTAVPTRLVIRGTTCPPDGTSAVATTAGRRRGSTGRTRARQGEAAKGREDMEMVHL